MNKTIYTHTDKEGKRWVLSNLRPSEVTQFWLADSEGQKLRLHRTDIAIEMTVQKQTANVQEDFSI